MHGRFMEIPEMQIKCRWDSYRYDWEAAEIRGTVIDTVGNPRKSMKFAVDVKFRRNRLC